MKKVINVLLSAFVILSFGCSNVQTMIDRGVKEVKQDYQKLSVETNHPVSPKSNYSVAPKTRSSISKKEAPIKEPQEISVIKPPVLLDEWELGDWRYAACQPSSIAVDLHGNIFVITYKPGRGFNPSRSAVSIWKYDADGEATKWGGGEYGKGDNQFNNPHGITIDKSGNVFIADTGNERILKFDRNGHLLTKWGSHAIGYSTTGYNNGGFYAPWCIAVDGSGNVYVTDAELHSVQKFDNNGHFLHKWGGVRSQLFRHLGGLVIDSKNNIYMIGRYEVIKFNSKGKVVKRWGVSHEKGRFHSNGLAIDSKDNVYVFDPLAGRVQEFDSNGKFLTVWGSDEGFAEDVAHKKELTAECRERENIHNYNSPQYKKSMKACRKVDNWPPVFNISGMAIDHNDNEFTISSPTCRIYKLGRPTTKVAQ